MIIYIVQVILLLIFGIGLKPEKTQKKKKLYMWISFVILVVISARRAYTVGIDTSAYVSLFNYIDYISLVDTRYETGFLIYVKLLRMISIDPSILLFCTSVICIGSVCYFIYLYSPNPTLSIVLYILLGSYFSQMNIMRQELAIAISMIAFIVLIQNKKKILSVILLLLASTFHTVGMVLFLPYIMYLLWQNERIKDITVIKSLKWVLMVSVVCFVAYSMVMSFVERFFSQYVNYFTSEWGEANYFASLFNTLIHVVFLVIGAVYLKNKKLAHLEYFALVMLGLTVLFSTLSMRMEIWNRIAGMFEIFTSILWAPMLVANVRRTDNRLIVQSAIIGCSFLYMIIVLVFRPEWSGVVPYQFRN